MQPVPEEVQASTSTATAAMEVDSATRSSTELAQMLGKEGDWEAQFHTTAEDIDGRSPYTLT